MEGKSVFEQDAQATRRTTALRRSTLESLGGNSQVWIRHFANGFFSYDLLWPFLPVEGVSDGLPDNCQIYAGEASLDIGKRENKNVIWTKLTPPDMKHLPGIPTPNAALPPSKPVYSTPSPVENIPQNNECKMVELRGAKVASFTVDGCELICLPQAFDLFLKHLVGGLHTVYTKLKRLEITPVVCNVEQVRILRGLGAIQPGVNRCKLISRKDFETLYNDCTNAR
ncbi:hypothetical protein CCH79_00002539 [Gambusia affinis]|uniref:SKI/SNO/DAC domain-containing protein n=1 Tax=Gambusia affinis TaxID=33528 RepID=A0A315WLL8_GAMAF|nr:hypothetical protein CCH79_00002539 [Gambusia affinis]